MEITLRPDDVLLVVDLQYDFLPGGSLAVSQGDEIVAPIEALAQRFDNVVLTQDWHTPGHISFASSHKGKSPFETTELRYGTQVLWPDHCVMGTRGAEIASEKLLASGQLVIRKGFHPEVDSYSAFREADRTTRTGLAGYLQERRLGRIFAVGLATDFCVSWSALDAVDAGFDTYVVEDLARAIDTAGSLQKAHSDWAAKGVQRISSADIRG